MKNLFGLLIAVVSWAGITKALTEKDAIGALEGMASSCSFEPDEQDYKDLVRNTENPRQSTKCFRHCLLDKLEMLDGCKLDINKFQELSSMIFEDKDEELAEIGNKCNAKVTCESECDNAHDLTMCVLGEFKSKNWSLPELEKGE